MSEAHIQYEDEGPARRINIHPEYAVQRAVVRFVAKCVAVPHEFASHDRGQARSANEHQWDALRGIRSGWMDVELLLEGGITFRCELKAPGKKPDPKGKQIWFIDRMNALGHPAAWANSVTMFAKEALKAGIPLRASWPAVAEHEDALAAADIRAQELKAKAKRAGTWKPGRPRVAKSSPGMVARYRGVGVKV